MTKLTPLEMARLKRKEMAAAGIKIEILDPMQKAKANPNSRKLAINAMCFDCQGGNADASVKWRIGNCSITVCPLHNLRPYKNMEGRDVPAVIYQSESNDIESNEVSSNE